MSTVRSNGCAPAERRPDVYLTRRDLVGTAVAAVVVALYVACAEATKRVTFRWVRL